jgi:hypothetical protein
MSDGHAERGCGRESPRISDFHAVCAGTFRHADLRRGADNRRGDRARERARRRSGRSAGRSYPETHGDSRLGAETRQRDTDRSLLRNGNGVKGRPLWVEGSREGLRRSIRRRARILEMTAAGGCSEKDAGEERRSRDKPAGMDRTRNSYRRQSRQSRLHLGSKLQDRWLSSNPGCENSKWRHRCSRLHFQHATNDWCALPPGDGQVGRIQ